MELSKWFPLLFGLLMTFAPFAVSQQRQNPASKAVDWDAMTSQIETAVASEYCGGPRDDIDILDTADLTGNGTTEALVDYCHEGAYMDLLALIRLENGKPTVARFRDEHGKATDPDLKSGASAMHGCAIRLVPDKHAVVQLCWNSDDAQPFECGGVAYIWNARNKTFDENPKVGGSLADAECRKEQKVDDDLKSH